VTSAPPANLGALASVAALSALLDIPSDEIPGVLGELQRVQTVLWERLRAARRTPAAEPSDRLLTVREAAARLSVSVSTLQHRTRDLPFVVRLGRCVRYSERGIEDYIRRQTRSRKPA
jgi:predicted DNA-binding transcriptional regulator AlpA